MRNGEWDAGYLGDCEDWTCWRLDKQEITMTGRHGAGKVAIGRRRLSKDRK